MKKIVALILTLCMLCTCAFALATAEDVAGVWYLTAIESDGMELPVSMFGMEMTMTLNTDGTALLESNMAETEIGTWAMNGAQVEVIDAVGEAQLFDLVDDRLAGEQDGMKMILSREAAEEVVQTESPVKADATREEFNGTWVGSHVMLMGMQMPMSMLDMGIVLEITSDGVTMTTTEEGVSETQAVEFTFDQGALTVGELILKLHEDGMMSYTEEETGMAMYFEKSAE